MENDTGWRIDPATLTEVVSDSSVIKQALCRAAPAQRLLLLRLLGQDDQALAEAATLLDEPAVRAAPWQALLQLADLHRWRRDFDTAGRLQVQAWRRALGREQQSATLYSIGVRQFQAGDPDAAAASFQLALTLLSLFGDTAERARTAEALAAVRGAGPSFDALILAGGSGRRLGGPAKPLRKVAGWPMLDHVLLACSAASRRIVAGPSRLGIGEPVFCREDPVGSGPVAAISAGLHFVQQPVVLLLAADLPFIAGALGSLRAALGDTGADVAALIEPSGRVNYLAAAWRTSALYAALDRLGEPAGRPMRALYEGVQVSYLPDFDAFGADCDTPADLRTAQERIRRHSPGQLPAAPLAWPRLELHSPS